MQALGPNIGALLRQCPNGHFSLPTCFKLVYKLIERIRALHELGFLHNDVKLENILMGHQDTNKLYLIDFGLSMPFIDD